jgi:dipeptide/tripeptide permease
MKPEMQQLVEWLQQASPVVWQAAYRAVWVDAIESFAWFVMLAGIAIRCAKHTKANWKSMEEGRVVWSVLIIMLALAAVTLLTNCITDVSNPTWEAIKEIAGLLPHGK